MDWRHCCSSRVLWRQEEVRGEGEKRLSLSHTQKGVNWSMDWTVEGILVRGLFIYIEGGRETVEHHHQQPGYCCSKSVDGNCCSWMVELRAREGRLTLLLIANQFVCRCCWGLTIELLLVLFMDG